MALKDNKPRLYSTFWDIVSAAQQIATEQVDMSEQNESLTVFRSVIKFKAQLELACLSAKNIINAALECLYSEADFRRLEAPWITPPVHVVDNTGDWELISIGFPDPLPVPFEPYTAAWTLTFSSASAFGAFSSLEGLQSTTVKTGGAVGGDFTPTNSNFVVETAAWFPGPASFQDGDQLWFSIIDVHPLIWQISNMLATSKALREIYVAETPNLSDFAEDLWKKAWDMINKLQNPDDENGMLLYCMAQGNETHKSIPVIYGIDAFGSDHSPYLDSTPDGETSPGSLASQ